MDLTLFLAQLFGVYMLVAGVSGLLYPARMKRAMEDFQKSTLIPYFDGALALIIGLLIVLNHNMWDSLMAGLVSLFGWLALIEGLAMLLLPEESMKGLVKALTSKSASTVFAIVAVVVGAYLVYMGFFA